MAGRKIKVQINPELHALAAHTDGDFTIRRGETVDVDRETFDRITAHTQIFGGFRVETVDGKPGWQDRTHQTIVRASDDVGSDEDLADEKGV